MEIALGELIGPIDKAPLAERGGLGKKTSPSLRGTFRAGNLSAADVVPEAGDGGGDRGFQIRVRADEFGHVAAGQSEQIVDHEHLPIAARASADANGGNGQLLGNAGRL